MNNDYFCDVFVSAFGCKTVLNIRFSDRDVHFVLYKYIYISVTNFKTNIL